MTQTVHGITLHQAHCARIDIWPDTLRAIIRFSLEEPLRYKIKCGIPTRLFPDALTLRASTNKRLQQAVGMMNTLGITRNLGADDTRCIGIFLGTAHTADLTGIQNFNIQRAGRWTIVGTG